MPHCDFGVQWKMASDLQFQAAMSGPKAVLSVEILVIELWQ